MAPSAPARIQAVTFDAGGTLIEPWPSVGHVYAEIAARYGFQFDPTEINRRFAIAWRQKTDFDYGRESWAELVKKTFASYGGVPPEVPFFDALYDRFASPAAWRVYEDVWPVLEALSRRALKLAVISNWDERLRPLMQSLDLDRFFASLIISSEVGFQKPAAAIFAEAVRRLGVPAGSILHVGDSAEEDAQGARAAGLRAAHIVRGGARAAAGQILSLRDLAPLLDDPEFLKGTD